MFPCFRYGCDSELSPDLTDNVFLITGNCDKRLEN